MKAIRRFLRSLRLKSVKLGPLTFDVKAAGKLDGTQQAAAPDLSEDAIRAANPEDISFREVEIRISDTWDDFREWLTSQMSDGDILSIAEDQDYESSFYCSGKPGALTWRIRVSGTKESVPFVQYYDLIRDWLHPLALKLAPPDAGIPWDTSLFPVKDSNDQESKLDAPDVDVRDAIYWVLFAAL